MSNDVGNQPAFGQICWLQIAVYDVKRASKLYSEIFSWKVNEDALPTDQHGIKAMHMFECPGKKLGGGFLVMEEGYQMTRYGKLEKEVLPPLPTFCVKDCNETLKQVEGLGGSTQAPKTAIGGDMGHYARFTDSEGNVIGIWSQD
ncbi:Glyoxalase/bleomycin resistance protein/dioxygenase [Metarhizium album ARSEF 1941]|uniref:Glyoxalase/bleomycin resistance protein/dioxygenase n=1 Tax=Metarhizium album (strain ARSEF 1941) TaxID=1081103 RepID=A0A0B2WRA3_METAS|nr:Glyoxalase/bleomycin resistance protein/dioxygenase [Metarhizium album ARSEF 1941]KHN96144.1 Glyoxalase/bleomycin resistance protein/dioxygenase [Metarhizium album ARSEF 1941]